MRRERYYNPIEGRPAPLEVTNLVLFSPEVELKLHGCSFRPLFKEAGHEGLYRRIAAARKPGGAFTKKLAEEMIALLADGEFKDTLTESSADPDMGSDSPTELMGPWAAFIRGIEEAGESPSAPNRLLKYIEAGSSDAARLLREDQIEPALESLERHHVIRECICPEVREAWGSSLDRRFLLYPLMAILLEVRLCWLAAWDSHWADRVGMSSPFSDILPLAGPRPKTPNSRFFDWLKSRAGAKSINSLLDDSRMEPLLAEGQLNASTLKRWSCGSHAPDRALLSRIGQALFSDARDEAMWMRYWGARQFTFLGYVAETLSHGALPAVEHELGQALLPWPQLPFGHETFEAWCQARYPFWLQYHRNNGLFA